MKKKIIRVVAIIPARSGSKSIKDKNIQKINKKPLLAWSIETCKRSKEIDYFFVLTDSLIYKKISQNYGSPIPFGRPKSISKDSSKDIEFVKYSIKELLKINIKPEVIVNIRPTTPFRDYRIVDRAIRIFMKKNKNFSSLRSVEEMPETALKTVFVEKNLAKPIFNRYSMDFINSPRQNFKKTFLPNGYIDIYKVSNILEKNILYGKKVFAYKTPRTIEIDSKHDLALARKIYKI